MKRATILLSVCMVLASSAQIHAQNFQIRRVYISANRATVISGEQVQFWALADGADGTVRTTGFEWGTSDENIAVINDSGLVTTTGVGLTDVWVQMNGWWTSMTLQVVPSRIDIEGALGEVTVGQVLQLTAVARDVDGQPIPGVKFDWQTIGPHGYYTRVAYITEDGLFYPEAQGFVTVRANLNFWGAQGSQQQRVFASTEILVRQREDFRLTRLIATGPIEGSFRVVPAPWTPLAGNDHGELAFVATLDGLTEALMRYSNEQLEVLTSAGGPGLFPGSIVRSIQNPAINNNGQVLSVTWADRGSGTLNLYDGTGNRILAVEGESVGSFLNINGFQTSPFSLNDSAEVAFRVNYNVVDSDEYFRGMVGLTSGELRIIWGESLPLAAFPDGYEIDWNNFGIDASGRAYFTVFEGANKAIYRADGLSLPAPVVITGTALEDGTLEAFNNFALSPNGTLLVGGLIDGRWAPLRYSPNGTTTFFDDIDYLGRIHSVNDSGQFVFSGNVGEGFGFYRSNGTAATPLVVWGDAVGDSTAGPFNDAILTSSGEVYGQIGTPENNYVIIDTSDRQVLFQSGDRTNASAHSTIDEFVHGATSGPPQVYAGGDRPSLFDLSAEGFVPRWVRGELPNTHPAHHDLNAAARNPRGNLYFATSSGVFRDTGTLETLVEYPATYSDILFSTVQLNWTASWRNFFVANDAGTVVWMAGTDSDTRLVQLQNGILSTLALFGTDAGPTLPEGGLFERTNCCEKGLAIDDTGRVMANVSRVDGSAGLFLFDGTSWTPVAIEGETVVGGGTVQGADAISAAGNRFYASFYMVEGGTILAEYSSGQWTAVVRSGDELDNGSDIYWVSRRFDANRNGDIAFAVSTGSGDTILLREANGTTHTVYQGSSSTGDGDRFLRRQDYKLDLREDGSLYFMGIDVLDRKVVYHAQPLF